MKRFLMIFFLLIFFVPVPLLAQAGEPPTDYMAYFALAFNSGLVALIVQLLKNKAMPWLKTNLPYVIPLMGMAVGIATGYALQATGIDISPIGDVFGAGIASGALASAGFVVLKEADNKLIKGR